MAIKFHKTDIVDVNTIKLDPDNPNQLNDKQMSGLAESIRQFGYLQPVIIDQNDVIVDGEHRFLIMKAQGETNIPVVRVEVQNDIERRIIRQAMNKLRGEHQLDKDVAELELIMQNDAARLESLLGINESELETMRALMGNADSPNLITKDPSPLESRLNTYLHGTVRQITLYFTPEQYEEVLTKFEKIMAENKLESNTDAVLFLMNKYEQHG